MSLIRPNALDGRIARAVAQGDTVASMEVIQTLSTAQLNALSAANLLGPVIQCTATAAALAATLPSAATAIAGISAGLGSTGVEAGTAWRLRVMNNVPAATTAAIVTLTATSNTGMTVTAGIVNCASVKDFLVTVVNGTPAQTYSVASTSGSAVLTGLTGEQTKNLSVGMIVTTSALNVQGQTIISVQPGTGVTLSGNANATAASTSLTFSPVMTFVGIGQSLV